MAITVRVMRPQRREGYVAYWFDPVTGKRRQKATGETRRREAERFAARLETQLNTQEETTELSWQEFKKRLESGLYANHRAKTVATTKSTINLVTEILNPQSVSVIKAAQVLQLQEHLRNRGVSESTVKRHSSELRKVLNWAHRNGYLATVPRINMPTQVRTMKGRPITPEEFDRMIDACHDVLGAHQVDSWQFLLRGLWWSGLRLSEAMLLHWTDDSDITVDMKPKRPLFVIQAHAEKAGKDRLLPMAPEFAEQLQAVPVRQRKGFVFKPLSRHGERPLTDWVGKVISNIGESAKVVVAKQGAKTKYASAHDLRRSFGERWSNLLMPKDLMVLMRHENIETTMKFYVGRNAASVADAVWNAKNHNNPVTAIGGQD